MSIATYIMLYKLTLAAGGFGAVILFFLCRKLEIYKACCLLWGIPMHSRETANRRGTENRIKPEEKSTAVKTEEKCTQILPRRKTQQSRSTNKTIIKYEETYIHTNEMI